MFEQTILIVDDEKSNRRILKDLLQEQAKIIFAKNGHQALELAKKHRPDLILMDVLMPEFSGFDVIDVLKNDNQTMNIAVIFITGLTNSDDEAQGFSLGCCDYIYKPFKSNVVIARVMMHLELIRQRKILNDIAHIDALTGVSNRRKMDEVLKEEIAANNRNKTTLVIAMLDIDFFKPFNDHYGHGAGDIALRQVGDILRESCKRPRDFVARYGGEEFVVVLPDSTLAGASLVLQGIMTSISEKQISHQYSDVSSVLTVSIGAIVLADCPNCTVDNVLEKADQLLYQAKDNGRNQLLINKD
ncbi:MAG: diguanylate cyclase [Colwellia sp.]|nr:diguanylate cyclase [Colwellia sp.]